jgi:predicted transposase/invertase (TIGR01784 family)
MTTDKDKSEEKEVIVKRKERPLVSFDWAIKHLLRNKANFDVVEGFLSELLQQQVKIMAITESESNKAHSVDKSNRMDVVAENEEGEIILIELQFTFEADYFHQMLYRACQTLVEHANRIDDYMRIKKVYSISTVYFDYGQGTDYLYSGKTYFTGVYDKDVLHLADMQRRMYHGTEAGDIHPQYYILRINKFNSTPRNTLDEWFYFLKHDRIKEGFSAKGLIKARDILDYSRLSPEERANYDYEKNLKSNQLSQAASRIDRANVEAEQKYTPVIETQAKVIEEKDRVIEERDREIAKQAREIAEYKRLLNIE